VYTDVSGDRRSMHAECTSSDTEASGNKEADKDGGDAHDISLACNNELVFAEVFAVARSSRRATASCTKSPPLNGLVLTKYGR